MTPLFLFLVCVLAQEGCRSTPSQPPVTKVGPSTCRLRKLAGPSVPDGTAAPKTVPAGTIPGSFSVTSTGEATYVMPLTTVPGRAGVEPRLAITYDSSGEDGVLGVGFSLAGPSAITRCPQNLAQDGEIAGVGYGETDKLCLDGKRLVPVGQAKRTIEYRTFPDTQTRVIGRYPLDTPDESNPASALSFEAHTPSGLVIEYGGTGLCL